MAGGRAFVIDVDDPHKDIVVIFHDVEDEGVGVSEWVGGLGCNVERVG